jgi:hypothetical protein
MFAHAFASAGAIHCGRVRGNRLVEGEPLRLATGNKKGRITAAFGDQNWGAR